MLKKLWKNDDGFTLVEALISIATLALISGFILQMFMVSSNANTKAQNIDIASTEAINVIETIKAYKSYEELFNNALFEYAQSSEDEDLNTSYFWYDSNWNLIGEKTDNRTGDFSFESDNELYPRENARFALKVSINLKTTYSPDEESYFKYMASSIASIDSDDFYKYRIIGHMVNIKAECFELDLPAGKKSLVSYEASKYFSAD